LNIKINDAIKKNHPKDSSENLTKYTHKFIKKITDNLNNFNYNVIIANLHEAHSFLNKEVSNIYKQDTLKENYKKILTTILPIIPHFSNECLGILEKNYKPKWPTYNEKLLEEDEINIVIQINGKKRGLITTKKDQSEEQIFTLISGNKNLYKYIENKKIKKNVFIKNKLINIII
jgi:leucyl-tRNA synthetase